MKIGIVLGTRPEIIKLSSIIRELQNQDINFFIIHTNQHFNENMDKVFFKELQLPLPNYNLNINSCPHYEMIGKMILKLGKIYEREKPDIILVQGDTNSTLAGAITANKLNIKIGHVEAGLRSYDKSMPEEINRILTDHISEFLFCPTQKQADILIREGIEKEKIYIVGNTIVDALYQNIKIAQKKYKINGNYILLTIHRPSNVDNKENLEKILKGIEKIISHFKIPVIFPIHPRTRKNIEKFNIKIPQEIKLIEPQGYLKFLILLKNSRLIITDSGGLQEEGCILNIPCITIRENTERPNTVEIGANVIAGIEPDNIFNAAQKMLNQKSKWKNPYGDGKTAIKIIEILKEKLK